MKTQTVTLQIKTSALKKLLKAIKKQDKTLTVENWIENEFNNNTDAIIEMLLEDF